jgi:hypothetical protein
MSNDHTHQLAFPTLSRVQNRLIQNGIAIRDAGQEQITYQHTVLCQTCLPYRNPGDDQTRWECKQGNTGLVLYAGEAMNPSTQKWVRLGLPFGPKPRLVLMHLNAEAIKTGSPIIEVEDSMTAFVRRVLRYAPNGRDMRTMKDQLARLSAATVRLAIALSLERTVQVSTQMITAFDLWFPTDDRQRILWPSRVRLSQEYFDSLSAHAVPLDERAISALAHSAMGLDVYSWLAQRLHRIEAGKPQFITWKSLKEQFGWSYKRIRDFRRVFLDVLSKIHSQYPAARMEADQRGITLHHSPPPIQKRLFTLPPGTR